jgi:GTPase
VREENDVRIAVIGNVDSGKSTLVGVLTKCIMDDGRGSARSKVFNFDHEQKNGRTSSIGQEIMGFNDDAKQVELERTTSKN